MNGLLGVFNQRAENGGVGSVVVGFCVFGAPRFSAQRSQNTYFEGFPAPPKRENQPRRI